MIRFLFILLLLVSTNSYSNSDIDSLLKVIEKVSEEESIESINKLASIYRSKSPKMCKEYAQKALELSQKYNDIKQEALAYNHLGAASIYLSEFDDALNYFQIAKPLYEKLGDKKSVAGIMNSIGLIYRNLKKYEKAKYYYETALAVVEELNDRQSIAGSLNNLGILYYLKKDLTTAKSYFERSLKIKEETGDKNGIANSYNNLGMIYGGMKDYNSALKHYTKALNIKEEINDKNGMVSTMLNIGHTYYNIKEFDLAVDYHKKSAEFAKKEGLKDKELKAYHWLAGFFDEQQDYKKSLDYFEKYSALKDSLYNRESAKKLAEYEANLGMERQKKENEILRKENEFNSMLNTYLIIISILVLLLAFLAYSRYRAKQKINEILNKKNHEITEQKNRLADAYNELELKSNELKHRNKFLQMLMDSIPNPVFFKDTDMKYTGCNKEFEKFAGRSREELIGRTVFDFTYENIAKLTTEKDLNVLETDEILQYEATVFDKKNRELDIIYYKTRFFDYEGNVAGLIGVMLDITERKNAERILKQSEIMLRNLNETKDRYLNIINRELKNAEEYLVSQLPEEITEGNIQTQWLLKPSIHLGGDALGYHWIDDDNIAIYLLDVSGHGIGACLHSVAILNTIKNERLKNTDFRYPEQVLGRLNNAFQMLDHNDMFFTIWYGVYNKKTKTLKYANGGHHPAFVIDEKGKTRELFEPNTLIGAVPAQSYSSAEFEISNLTTLFVFSDGAYEITMENEEMLGYENLCQFILECHQDKKDDLEIIYEYAKGISKDKTMKDDYSMIKSFSVKIL